MEMGTKDMTCDEQTAHYGQSDTEFYVNMYNASPVPQQNNDNGNQQGGSGNGNGIDQFNPNPNPSTNAPNANSNNNNSTFSGGSNFTPTTMTRVSSDQSMTAPPVTGLH
jgi:hypothetical protein